VQWDVSRPSCAAAAGDVERNGCEALDVDRAAPLPSTYGLIGGEFLFEVGEVDSARGMLRYAGEGELQVGQSSDCRRRVWLTTRPLED
jgi:hypothetical protein